MHQRPVEALELPSCLRPSARAAAAAPSVLPRADVNERNTSLEIVHISKLSNSRGDDQKYKLNCNRKAIMYCVKNLIHHEYPYYRYRWSGRSLNLDRGEGTASTTKFALASEGPPSATLDHKVKGSSGSSQTIPALKADFGLSKISVSGYSHCLLVHGLYLPIFNRPPALESLSNRSW
ncbi:hypothetical protein J6590_040157 [Homalodisca vitripennis]|nr:hypothetical protein J6590_040157 [Homalodisca vitripennis]